jgi:hypothetical protein
MRIQISVQGLRSVLRRFARTKDDFVENKKGHWSIGNGGYDCWWELYYDNCPVAACILGTLENVCLDPKDFERLQTVVDDEYPDMRRWA